MSRDITCPLHKKYRRDNNQTSTSSDEELDRNMVVDNPVAPTNIRSSQPTDDETVVFRPARVDDSPPPTPSATLSDGAALRAELARWSFMSLDDLKNIPLDELKALPESSLAHMRAVQLGTSIQTVIESLNHV